MTRLNNKSNGVPITANELQVKEYQLKERFLGLAENMMSSRVEWMRKFGDPRRDLDAECGYPKRISLEEYRHLYERDCIARRIVDVLPKETWKVQPLIYESEDSEAVTPFEQALQDLNRTLAGNSWYQDDEGSPFFEVLKRADTQSGIGSYGVILIGVDGTVDLKTPLLLKKREENKPAPKVPKSQKIAENKRTAYVVNNMLRRMGSDLRLNIVAPDKRTPEDEFDGNPFPATAPPPAPVETERKLLFLRVFDEQAARIVSFETNPADPRFGQPVMYDLTFNEVKQQSNGQIGLTPANHQVHWTRLVHITDNVGMNEIIGTPRLQPAYNRVVDLQKLYGGSAEMYWKGAFPGLSIETIPQLGAEVEMDPPDEEKMRTMLEDYQNGLQRYLSLFGMQAKSLAPQVADPTNAINVQLEAICIYLDIPKRIFSGSERGELASSQDTGSWDDTVAARQNGHATPNIVVKVINRFIEIGILPEPAGYSVVWPDLTQLTAMERADVALKLTQALSAYVAGNVEAVMPPMDYFTKVLGFDQEEAQAIVDSSMEMVSEDRLTEDPNDLAREQMEMDAELTSKQMEQDAALTKEQLKHKSTEGDKSRKLQQEQFKAKQPIF